MKMKTIVLAAVAAAIAAVLFAGGVNLSLLIFGVYIFLLNIIKV